MAKLFKCKIKRERIGNRTHYTYPPLFKKVKPTFGPIYEGGLDEGAATARERGLGDEYILIGVDDKDAPEFSKPENFQRGDGFSYSAEEVTREGALELGNMWTRQVEKILDQRKVIQICAKAVRGELLTQEEKDALDPENPEPGINFSKSFEDSLDEYLEGGE